MRDEEISEPECIAQIGQQVDDRRLNRGVEGGDRLVTNYEFGIGRQRASDRHALLLAAAQLVWIATSIAARQLHHVQQLGHPSVARSGRHAIKQGQWPFQCIHNRQARIERGIGILKHDLRTSPEITQVALGEAADIGAGELNSAGARIDQTQEQPAERRLTAALSPTRPTTSPGAIDSETESTAAVRLGW